jgi:hypothetical protein
MPKSAKINKKHLLAKFVDFPQSQKRDFYMKEFKLLNNLIDRYSLEFVSVLHVDKKYNSLAVLLCDSFKASLDVKFRNFNYKIDESKYEKIILSEIKSGEDLKVNLKLKTIRDFLNG